MTFLVVIDTETFLMRRYADRKLIEKATFNDHGLFDQKTKVDVIDDYRRMGATQ